MNEDEALGLMIKNFERRLLEIINYDIDRHHKSGIEYLSFKDKKEYQELVEKVIESLKEKRIEYLEPLVVFVEKLLSATEDQERRLFNLELERDELKANLDGISLDNCEINGKTFWAPANNPYAEEIGKELKKINKDITNSKKEERLPLYQRALELMVKSQKEKINYNKKQSMAAAHKELKGINLHLYEEIDLNFENICKTYNNWLKEAFPSGEYGLDKLDETLDLSFYKDYDKIKIQDFFDHRTKRKKLTF